MLFSPPLRWLPRQLSCLSALLADDNIICCRRHLLVLAVCVSHVLLFASQLSSAASCGAEFCRAVRCGAVLCRAVFSLSYMPGIIQNEVYTR